AVRCQRRLVVCSDIAEEFFVSFLLGLPECGTKELFRDPLLPTVLFNERAYDSNMIEGVRICGKRLNILKPHDLRIRDLLGDQKDPTGWKVSDKGPLILNADGRIERAESPRSNDGIHDCSDGRCVVYGRLSNQEAHEPIYEGSAKSGTPVSRQTRSSC